MELEEIVEEQLRRDKRNVLVLFWVYVVLLIGQVVVSVLGFFEFHFSWLIGSITGIFLGMLLVLDVKIQELKKLRNHVKR
ncbi:hypothetical protein DRO69_00395 [Candidatus Bathyarchaeota archaeon]|nr:MAG: hypothetical protein DRO69_00395 [Candidatus Bathyarchaeota archaeon]